MKEENIMEFSTEMLERKVSSGDFSRSEHQNLHGGKGKCIIYTSVALSKKDIDSKIYESGVICLEKGASIGEHFHYKDSETYHILTGEIEYNGKTYRAGDIVVCEKDTSHYCINLADGETKLRYDKKLVE